MALAVGTKVKIIPSEYESYTDATVVSLDDLPEGVFDKQEFIVHDENVVRVKVPKPQGFDVLMLAVEGSEDTLHFGLTDAELTVI